MKVILSESAYNLIIENTVYMDKKEIPSEIISWSKSKIGNVRSWKLHQQGQLRVSGAWHEQTINYYGVFHLINGRYIITKEFRISGKEPFVDSTTIDIPSGFLAVILDTYTNTADIYTSSDALKMVQDTSVLDKLTDEETMALYEAKTLKSFARYKFKDEVYNSLIQKGLMKANRSITTEGKNMVEAMSRANVREVGERLSAKIRARGGYHTFYA